MPFSVLGVDGDNGSEFINHHCWTGVGSARSPSPGLAPGRHHCNDGAHVEQKNWAVVRAVIGYHRYDVDDGNRCCY